MFKWYAELSKATDVFNSKRKEDDQIEYYEVLEMIEDKHSEVDIMETIIKLYSCSY